MNRIAVDQSPSGGSNYPFRFEHDLSSQLLDLFLSYDDSSCGYAWPFRIAWMYGFGDNAVAPLGDYTPTHDRDVVIVDAEDNVVFDSTTGDYQEVEWGDDRLIGEWYVDDQVLRLVWKIDAAQDDYLEPEDALLDPRTYVRLPRRVRGIKVNGQTLTGTVLLEAGYNVATSIEDPERVDGGEFTERILLDGVVGSGDGRLPGCDEVEPIIRRINNIGPDASGNFTIETDGCMRQQLLLTRYDSEAGYVAEYEGDDMTESEAMAAIKLSDDCPPCCPCPSYAYTYRGIARIWDKWAAVAAALEAVRDIYADNVDRWNEQRACRLDAPLKITAKAQPGSTTFVGANYCNMSHCCVAPVELRFTVLRYASGVLAAAPTVRVKEAYVSGTGIDGETAYAPQVLGNVIVFRFDAADPQRTTSVRMRVCYDGTEGDSVMVAGTVHFPDPPPNDFGETCIIPTPDVDEVVTDAWTDPLLGDDAVRAVAYRSAPVLTQEATYPCTSCDCS